MRKNAIGRLLMCIPYLLVAVAAFYWMYCRNCDFLWEVDRLNLFLRGGHFWTENVAVAGGALQYAGRFLTQFFYSQLWGSVVFAAMLLALMALASWAFRLGTVWTGLSAVLAVAVLLSCTQLGYMIYVLKTPGYMYTALLGLMVISALFGLYVRVEVKNRWLGAAVKSLALFGFSMMYALVGVYALALTLCCILYELLRLVKGEGRENGKVRSGRQLHRLVSVLVGAVSLWLVPAFYTSIFKGLNDERLYLVALLDFLLTDEERGLWFPFMVMAAALILMAVVASLRGGVKFSPTDRNGGTGRKHVLAAASVMVISLAYAGHILWHKSYVDANFYTTLAAVRAVENRDWSRVVELTSYAQQPTRTLVLLRNLALVKTGKAGDEMFRYTDGDAPYDAPRPVQALRLMAARPLYFNYGKVNFCYRWSMEDKVEYGLCPEYLIYMTRCALLNGEWAIARKYIATLKETSFYRGEAERYEALVGRKDAVLASAEFADVAPLMAYNDVLDGDGGLIEVYLLNNFAYMSGGNERQVPLSVLSSMVLKNPDLFWRHFLVYARHHKELPVHFQEAALLFGWLQNLDVSKLPIAQETQRRFMSMVELAQSGVDETTGATDPVVLQKIGGTYWYYYFFVKGLKTN